MPRLIKEERIKLVLDERKQLNKVHFILLIVSAALLFITGLLTLVFSGSFINNLRGSSETAFLNELNLILLSSAWMFLSYFLAVAVYKMKKKLTREWIYLVLFFGVLTLFTGNIIAGILIFTVSIILLIKDIKLANKIH